MLELVIDRRRADLGGGFEVGRVLPFRRRRMVGPFIFFDHMGPADFEPGMPRGMDVRPHPHIGLSTITYLFDGELMHRDSVGSEQAIRPGEVNWMTAGSGITHSERFEKMRAHGGHMHGIQSWVALPEGDEETDPAFHHHGRDELPEFDEGGIRGRLVAGRALGLEAPVRTHSPMFYLHCELEAGSTFALPDEHPERAVYVAQGGVEHGGQVYGAGQMLVFGRGATAVTAREPTLLMVLGGEPLGERFIDWNFVSSSKERIGQAKADWRAGRMKLPDLDHDEWIPLPGGPAPPEPMS
ncbi:pirin family protein [Lysobacter sp. GX 14042]|uniref:pirin family protein n=1 Tax=Lysobacter sp. GX 14042 TaxID=2907155 RepID=UPI001F4045C8|nr:pirin family protein [Lysobacter sp. GX 14042]MCE7032546.1 pirin family protein [Lysobacter sp. GX 14042]